MLVVGGRRCKNGWAGVSPPVKTRLEQLGDGEGDERYRESERTTDPAGTDALDSKEGETAVLVRKGRDRQRRVDFVLASLPSSFWYVRGQGVLSPSRDRENSLKLSHEQNQDP